MASQSKKRKTDRRHHWGRDGKFLKGTLKLKRVCMYNPSMRQTNKKIEVDE